MGNENWSGLRYWEGTEAASVRLGTKALTTSASAITVPTFATTAARDTAAAAWVAEGAGHTLQGLTCYVTARAGICVHDNDSWTWQSQNNLLFYYAWAGYVASAGVGATTLITDTGVLSLPPGQRLVQIMVYGDLQGDTGGTGPTNLSVAGYGIFGNLWAPVAVSGQPGQSTVGRTWWIRASNTVQYTLSLIHSSGGAGTVGLWNPYFQIIDMGPVD